MNEPTPEPLIELSLPRGEPFWSKVVRYLRFRWARVTAVAAIVAGAIAFLGHTLGGVAGLWEFYRVAREGSTPSSHGAVPAKATSAAIPRLSFVVLPFANLSGDPAQDALADAITEDLTTDISRLRGSFVIGHATALTYKGKAVDVKQLGHDLKVRYVLEGSVQRVANQVRVNVHLSDVDSGSDLWSERFDVGVGDLLDLQNQVTGRIQRALEDSAVLVNAENSRAKLERPDNPDAVDLLVRARAVPRYLVDAKDSKEAIGLAERALKLEPEYVDGLVWLAHFHTQAVSNAIAYDPPEQLRTAIALVDRALVRDPNFAFAWHVKGNTLRYLKSYEEASAAYRKAISLAPNFPHPYRALGNCEMYLGRSENTVPLTMKAMEIDPKNPYFWTFYSTGGSAHLVLGHDHEAVQWLSKSLQAEPTNVPATYFFLASAYANDGQTEKAKETLQQYLRRRPGRTIALERQDRPSNSPVFVKQFEHVLDGLRKAGMPEA